MKISVLLLLLKNLISKILLLKVNNMNRLIIFEISIKGHFKTISFTRGSDPYWTPSITQPHENQWRSRNQRISIHNQDFPSMHLRNLSFKLGQMTQAFQSVVPSIPQKLYQATHPYQLLPSQGVHQQG